MSTLHHGLANTTTLFMLIMGIWALVLSFRSRPLDGSFFGIVAVGEILLVVQVSLGLILVLGGSTPPRPFLHYLYGVFALFVLPAVYYYTHGGHDRRAALMWFFTGIFMFGLALRFSSMGRFG